jgi:HEPN domain-containing protein/YHS domain-containing protein
MKVKDHPKFACGIELEDGRTYYFCGTGCMIRTWLHPEVFLGVERGALRRAAETLLLQDPPLLYPSCFHSQQAAEKYLKAYLTRRQVEFPKTHSIREILDLVRTVDEELAAALLPSAALTPYGVEVRYPGDVPEPSQNETEEALALA